MISGGSDIGLIILHLIANYLNLTPPDRYPHQHLIVQLLYRLERIHFPIPKYQCKSTERNSQHWYKQWRIIHKPHSF